MNLTIKAMILAGWTMASAPGCAVIEPEDETDEETVAAEQALGITSRSVGWSSGITSNLGEWKSIECKSKYGDPHQLHSVLAYREPLSNLDSFVARLEVNCVHLGTDETTDYTVLFTAPHRNLAFGSVAAYEGDDYEPTSHDVMGVVDFDNGDVERLDCGTGWVVTGLKTRSDLSSGKIRDLQIICRQV